MKMKMWEIPKTDIREEWESQVDKNFKDWKIHHESVPCMKDTYVINEIKSFILSLLKAQRDSLVEEIENLGSIKYPDTDELISLKEVLSLIKEFNI